ncbi:MAG: TRZ/ATZ family hydrolase, partial [Pseudomonadota bacterium]
YTAKERVHREQSLLIPGLVNTHTHAAMALMRGIADDVALEAWLNDHIWPLEAQHVGTDFVRDGTRLALAEMIKGGITCFNDMYFSPDIVAEVASEIRMRASIGLIVIDFPTVWATGPDEYLSKAQIVYDSFASNPLISMQFAPHSPYTVSEATLARVRTQADQLDIGVHMHIHETATEVDNHINAHGERPLAQLERMGMLNGNLLAVHMTQLTDDEIALCAKRRVNIAHCPESNLKLASGMAPIGRLIAEGVNVSLGTDGAASNNDLDMLGEMRTAALLGKAVASDASALPAATVLRMATSNGARSLGINDRTGSLETGKYADITCVRLDKLHASPTYDPLATLVYSAGREDVTDVWVAGKPLLKNGELTTIDERAVLERTQEWNRRLSK